MAVLEFRRAVSARAIPLTVFIDLQAEYAAEGRAYNLTNIGGCLSNCRTLLNECRRLGLPIAHFRQLRPQAFFNTASRFSHWLPEFRPKPSEMVFERSLPSCYSNKEFCALVDSIDSPMIVLAGLTGERACLSTTIDAFHRGHVAVFIADASATRPLSGLSADDSHSAIAKVVSVYGEVTSTREFLDRIATIDPIV